MKALQANKKNNNDCLIAERKGDQLLGYPIIKDFT